MSKPHTDSQCGLFGRAHLRKRKGHPTVGLAAVVEALEPKLLLAAHYYGFTSSAGTWEQAEQEALKYGGHLVSITSQAEQSFVNANFLANNPSFVFWIGLTDKAMEG